MKEEIQTNNIHDRINRLDKLKEKSTGLDLLIKERKEERKIEKEIIQNLNNIIKMKKHNV